MRLLDEEFTQHNFKGVLRCLRDYLRLSVHTVNENWPRWLVCLMEHEPVYPNRAYPYLLHDRQGTVPNEVCSTDITYVLMVKGFLTLADHLATGLPHQNLQLRFLQLKSLWHPQIFEVSTLLPVFPST